MSQNSGKDFWILIYLPFAAGISSSGTLIPLFILFITGDSVSYIGIFSSITSLVSLFLTFIWGKLTDDTSRRKVFILISLFSGFGIFLGYAFSFNVQHLLILAIISGPNMYLFEHYPPELWEEKLSKLNLCVGLGSCIGMVFGAVFQMYIVNYSLFFVISSVLCLIAGIMGVFLLKDLRPMDVSLPKLRLERQIVGNLDIPLYSSLLYKKPAFRKRLQEISAKLKLHFTKYVIIFLVAIFLFYLSSSLTFTPLSAFMKLQSKIPDSWIFWIYLSYYVILTVSFIFVGKTIDKYGNRKILFLGLSLRILTYILFTIYSMLTFEFIIGVVGFIILAGIAGFSISFLKVVFSNVYPRLLPDEEDLGEMLAVLSIVGNGAGIIGAYLSGYIAEQFIYGYFMLFLISAILAGISTVVFFFIKNLK
ncbi:MAG: MFS transporter [Candidatus Helarchaeota archaeon]